MIGISVSSYYRDPKVPREEKAEQDANVRGAVELVRVEHPRAGYRPLVRYLRKRGIKIGETRLRRILRQFNLGIKPKRRFVKTTDSKHDFEVYKNLLPEMTVTGVNQVWVADITYIRVQTGFIYLAVILDVYSRKVIGWSISQKIDHRLTLSALLMAIRRRRPPQGVIHHTDRGVQYLCDRYVQVLNRHGFYISHSAKGNPYDKYIIKPPNIFSSRISV